MLLIPIITMADVWNHPEPINFDFENGAITIGGSGNNEISIVALFDPQVRDDWSLVRLYSLCPSRKGMPAGGRVLRESRNEKWVVGLTSSSEPLYSTIYPNDFEIRDLDANKDYVLILHYKKDSWLGPAIWTTAWLWIEAENRWDQIKDDGFNPAGVLFSDKMIELLGKQSLCIGPG